MSRMRRSAGFTLIELLVAITLASLVAVLGALVLRAAIDFHGRATGHIRQGEDLHAADRLLLREWSKRRAVDVLAGTAGLEFQTDGLTGPYPAGDQGALRVRYLCTATDAGEVALERALLARTQPDSSGSGTRDAGASGAESAAAPRPQWRVLRTEVLIPGLVACSFDYLQTREDRDARIAQWRAQIDDAEPVPQLVRLTLVTGRGEIAPLVYGADG